MSAILDAIAIIAAALSALCFWKAHDIGRPYERQWLRWLPDDPCARWRKPPRPTYPRQRWTWTDGSSTDQVRRMDLDGDR